MRNLFRTVVGATALSLVLGGTAMMPTVVAAQSNVEKGKAIAFDRKKGNCLSCHAIADGKLPGNIGPPLMAMKARFPERAALRAQIWDATVKNPNTMMPPFGKHRIVSESDIELIVDYIHSL